MQNAAAVDDETVGILAGFDAQGEVAFQLAVETLLDVARGDIFAVFAEEGRVVNGEKHRHCRFVDGDRGQGFGILVVADRISDLESVDTDDCADFAAGNLLNLLFAETLEYHEVLDLGVLHGYAVAFCEGDVLTGVQRTAGHLADCDTSDIGRVFERGDEHLGGTLYGLRFGDLVDYCVEQRGDAVGPLLPLV